MDHTPGKAPAPDEALLRQAGGASREEFLSLSRSYLELLRRSLIEGFAGKPSGKPFVRAYSNMVDSIVGVLYQRAAEEQGLSNGDLDVAIIGVGGYGRAELAPYSDVDILILCKRKSAACKRVISSFIQMMWDVGFDLGHSVHSLVESESTLARHMDSRTALFESRWVCGSRRVAREAARQIARIKRKDREAFLRRKIKDVLVRYKRFGTSYQLVEPNVKASPGGLRDYQTLVWLGLLQAKGGGLPALRRKRLLLAGEVKALDAAYDFLLCARVELHLATQSKQDHLTLAMQKAIAERIGYTTRGGHLAVERFMQDYYNHTRTIFRITDDIIEELQHGKNLGILLGGRKSPRPRSPAVRVDRRQLRRDPLAVFARQKDTGVKLDRATRRRLEQVLAEDLSSRSARASMRSRFPDLLEDGRNLSLVLRSMHDTGFLGAIIPEYDELTSLKRYDLYHHYTVDEHSFQVVQNLELLGMRHTRLAQLARLYSEIADKRTLYLAALLHDIGKIEGRGHAKKGARLTRTILSRMGVNDETKETVGFLVEIHLLMSHTAQRRDPSDPDTLRAFCARVGTRTRLKYLCLLTYADLRATSPEVWTEWKRSLLWTLYLKAHEFMARKEKKPDAAYQDRKRAILRAFPAGEERDRALEHLDLLPGRYLLTMRAERVKKHMALIAALNRERAVVDHRRGRATSELTFCTKDKPFRLSQLCGVLTLNDCNILFAHAFTREDGKVIDVFQVGDVVTKAAIDDERVAKIERDVKAVLRGTLDLPAAVEAHVRKWKRVKATAIPAPVRVELENEVSRDVTIIDIFAPDKPGLLFDITRTLSEEGLVIHRARISTEADRAIDSFDVQDRHGRKVTSVDKLQTIRTALERALS